MDATSHIRPVVSATFDDPDSVSAAGLVPLMALARYGAGIRDQKPAIRLDGTHNQRNGHAARLSSARQNGHIQTASS